jgi:hypothetical protein
MVGSPAASVAAGASPGLIVHSTATNSDFIDTAAEMIDRSDELTFRIGVPDRYHVRRHRHHARSNRSDCGPRPGYDEDLAAIIAELSALAAALVGRPG